MSAEYLPAAGHDWALPFYDTMTRWLGVDDARRALLEQAAIRPGSRVLDVGCGTGTFELLVKEQHPAVDLVGLDPDSKALARARRKAGRAGVAVAFDRGTAAELPYADASFDRVFSSFMLHHIDEKERGRALREMWRVLKPGGSLHLLDFGGPESAARGIRGWMLRASRHTRNNFGSVVPDLMREAGFAEVELMSHRMLLAGPVAYYRAVRGA
ncbi:MAG: class I SAM-dependent methyltransferase [Thermoanaerobaculia bacterium]